MTPFKLLQDQLLGTALRVEFYDPVLTFSGKGIGLGPDLEMAAQQILKTGGWTRAMFN